MVQQDAELTSVSAGHSPAAARMRLHRGRRRAGLRCLMIELRETEIDVLIGKGLLNSEMRHDGLSLVTRNIANAAAKASLGGLGRCGCITTGLTLSSFEDARSVVRFRLVDAATIPALSRPTRLSERAMRKDWRRPGLQGGLLMTLCLSSQLVIAEDAESPKDDIAAQIRAHRYACDQPQSVAD